MNSQEKSEKEIREELTDGEVRIRRYRPGDEDALYEAVRESIPEVSPWLSFCHQDYSHEESAEWVGSNQKNWEAGEVYAFIVEDEKTGAFLGGCGLNQIDRINLRANLGYWVRSSQAGRGIITAATRLLAGFAYEDLGLVRLEIVVAVDNKASQRVAEKVGAVSEGMLRKRIRVREIFHDAISYSLLPEDTYPQFG